MKFEIALTIAALAIAPLSVVCGVSFGAQQVQTTTNTGKPTKTVQVDRGVVVLVQGNDLVVKMDDGRIRHFPDVPDSTRIIVDGQPVGIHDLKPGMKLQRTITTTTTPQTVTTVKTVTGTVWQVTPPNSMILTLEDGKNEEFKIPNGQKFNINGEMMDAFGLQAGMKITATKMVETPEEVVTQQRQITGTLPTPPPPQPPPVDLPILITVVRVTATPGP